MTKFLRKLMVFTIVLAMCISISALPVLAENGKDNTDSSNVSSSYSSYSEESDDEEETDDDEEESDDDEEESDDDEEESDDDEEESDDDEEESDDDEEETDDDEDGGTEGGGGTGGGNPGGGDNQPGTIVITDIPDENIPLAATYGGRTPIRADTPAESPAPVAVVDDGDLDAELEILDEEVPLAKAPVTGDISALWLALSGLSSSGMLLLNRKRKEED